MFDIPLVRSFASWTDMNFKKLRDIISVPGNGHLSAVTYPVSSFLRLHLSVPGRLEVIPSQEEKVVITTDENLQEFFEIVNSGRTLYITPGGKLRRPGFTSVLIQVFIRQLDTLHLACSGDIISEKPIVSEEPLEVKIQCNGDTVLNLEAPKIKLLAQCNGDVTLRGVCHSFEAKTQCNGSFNSRDLIAQDVVFSNQSNGNAWIYGEQTLRIRHRANGFLHYYGPGRLKDVVQFGTGEVRHMDEEND